MDILIITSTFHPLTGGAETYARLLATGLAEAGHTVVIATDGSWLPPGEYPERDTENGYTVLRLRRFADELDRRDKVKWRQLANTVPADLHDLLGGFRPDVVHANSHETLTWSTQVALDSGAALVASLHEQNPDLEPFGAGRCALAYRVLPVGVFFAASDFYAGRARHYGVPEDRLRLVYHGVDTTLADPTAARRARTRFGVADDEFLLVCPGRVYTRKAQLDLARALPEIAAAVGGVRLLLAGRVSDFDYADRMWKLLDELDVAHLVTLAEDLNVDEMPAILAAADAVVQPSLEEGLGLATIEAMAQARPVVGTDVVGLREVLTDEADSLVVPVSDAGRLATAVIRIAGDPGLAESLGRGARATVLRRFDRRAMTEATLAGYEHALRARR
ncbi:MAG TPA: glycosyltransferase family 4 protein [Actinophytocola sp.]|nr:glycosyltransferase family 4 protein [Actinophytocola sp.]